MGLNFAPNAGTPSTDACKEAIQLFYTRFRLRVFIFNYRGALWDWWVYHSWCFLGASGQLPARLIIVSGKGVQTGLQQRVRIVTPIADKESERVTERESEREKKREIE